VNIINTSEYRSSLRSGVMGRDIFWLLKQRAERYPEKCFLIWEPFDGAGKSWTYQRFLEDVESIAGELHKMGVRPRQRIILHLENCPEFILAWFACARLGAIAVSTNTRSVASDIQHFSATTKPVGIITQSHFVELLSDNMSGIEFTLVVENQNEEDAQSQSQSQSQSLRFNSLLDSSNRAPERKYEHSADLSIQFTSGTTSSAKAVLWTHANALFGAQLNAQHLRLISDDVTLLVLPLFHTNAQSYSMLGTLWSGGTIVLQPRFSASHFWPAAVKHKCSWTSLIPFCTKALASSAPPEGHAFRLWASAHAEPSTQKQFGIPTMGWWGMTETISHGIVGDPADGGPSLCIGRPSPGYDVEIRRPDGSLIGPGECGSLYIRGVRGISVFKEYYGDNEATNAAFDEQGWLDTGDVIAMDEQGDRFFSDRNKDMLKVGGENFAASEVEMMLLQSGWVSECAVVGQKHYMLDEVPVAFIIPLQDSPDGLSNKLIELCRTKLPDFKVPRKIFVVESLPRSTLEKIAKNELRKTLPEIKG
jgi:crotonobetaine/carnitine-CoA ligase